MSYGFRMVLAWTVGGALSALWAVAFWYWVANHSASPTEGADGSGIAAAVSRLPHLWRAYPLFLGVSTWVLLREPLRPPRFVGWVVLPVIVVAFVCDDRWQPFGLSSKTGYGTLWQYPKNAAMILGAVGIPGVLFLTVGPLLINRIERAKEHPTLRRWFLSGRGGSSRWAGPWSLSRHAKIDGTGIYMGRSIFDDDFRGREIAIKDDSHVLTVGCPGSGKSVSSIWPALLSYHGSAIVIDPKGEHARMTLGWRQDPKQFSQARSQAEEMFAPLVKEAEARHGVSSPIYAEAVQTYLSVCARGGTDTSGVPKRFDHLHAGKAWMLDPFRIVDCYPGARYNLLSEIDVNSGTARTKISAISGSCVKLSQGDNRFWEEAARLVLDGAIAHTLSTQPPERHNLPAVADLLLGIDHETGVATPDQLADLLAEMSGNPAAGGLPQQATHLFSNLGDRAYGNVTAELLTALKWCTDTPMRENLRDSDFTLASLMKGDPKTVYVAIPLAAMREQDRWMRCISELAMQTALEHRQTNPAPNPRTVFLLDELPQYGKMLGSIREGLVTLREAGMKLWVFVQNREQLVDCFGQEGARNFETGSTIQAFGVRDSSTAGWLAQKLGQHTTRRKRWKRWKLIPYRSALQREETHLVDPATIEAELRQGSPLQYVFTSKGAAMRLSRRAFKKLRIDGSTIKKMPSCPRADEGLRPR